MFELVEQPEHSLPIEQYNPTLKSTIELGDNIHKELCGHSNRNTQLLDMFMYICKKADKAECDTGRDLINIAHAVNCPYPITRESIIEGIKKQNKEFEYRRVKEVSVEINDSIIEKIDETLNKIPQNLPIKVTTPFKWLEQKPIFAGKNGEYLLINAQIEGGLDLWSAREATCKSLVLLLKKQEDGSYVETDKILPDGYRGKIVLKDDKSFEMETQALSDSKITAYSCKYEFKITDNGKFYIQNKKASIISS